MTESNPAPDRGAAPAQHPDAPAQSEASAAPEASLDASPEAASAAALGVEAASAAPDAHAAFTPDQARLVLRRVKDPELNLNIVDLGLIYDVSVVGNDVRVDMSLTSPGCPSGPEIMGEAEKELRTLPGIGEAVVNLVWTPAWTPERIEPRVRAYMGF